MVYKPNSVPLVGRRSLIWDRRCRLPQATYPESTRLIRADSPERTLPVMMLRHPLTLDGACCGGSLRAGPTLRFPIWSCTRWGLPCRSCHHGRGALLPHLFTLTIPKESESGGIFSVALSRIPAVAGVNGWGLPTTAPCGVRTFLPAYAERPPDHFIIPIVSD